MADLERLVISKIVTTGRVHDAVSRGIMPEHFADETYQRMYRFILDHVQKYNTPPTSNFIKMHFRDFEVLHSEDNLIALIDEFIVRVKVRRAKELVLDLAQMVDDPANGPEIDLRFLEASRDLATVIPSAEVHKFVRDMGMRQEDYRDRAQQNKPIGIPFGFTTLDAKTGGLQPHEFGVVTGFSGTGKSTLLSVIAFNMWAQGKTPLFITLEMGASELARKWDSMAAGLDYNRLKKLKLSDNELRYWQDKRKQVAEAAHDIPVIDSIRGCTPEHVFAETVRHNPDVVIIDYIGLMRTARPSRSIPQYQAISEITQDLKQNARTLKIPILAAAQTNRAGARDGAELENVANSISIIQDPDIVLGLYQNDEMEARRVMEVRINKNRDGARGKFECNWDYDNMIFGEGSSMNVFKRRNGNK